MKIKIIDKSYDEVMAIEPPKHFKPKKTNIFWQTLTKIISQPKLISTHFTHNEVGMERLGKNEPALILMNHSGFTDFEIAYSMLYPRKFNTVAAFETFMGTIREHFEFAYIRINAQQIDETSVITVNEEIA